MRRDHGEIDNGRFGRVGHHDLHVAAAAEAAHPRLHRTDGDTRGDGRVDGIAAGIEDAGTDRRGQVMLAGNEAAGGADGGFAHLPAFADPSFSGCCHAR